MNNYFYDIDKYIMNAFSSIMLSSDYVLSRKKRYRIFFYAYMFGCVNTDDLSLIFYDALKEPRDTGEQKNLYRSTLNYFCKCRLLSKAEDTYYLLTEQGINELALHLVEQNLLPDCFCESFKGSANTKRAYTAHASKTGVSVLSIIHSFPASFLIEPMFDYAANRISIKNIQDSRKGLLIPDAFFQTSATGQYIFLEADSCEERMNTRLIPKLQRYMTTILENLAFVGNITIHFSIWSKNETPCYRFDNAATNNAADLYSYFEHDPLFNISFSEYLASIKRYRGNNDFLLGIRNLLSGLNTDTIYSFDDLLDALQYDSLSQVYTRQFLTRKSRLLASMKAESHFEHLLCQGMRFVCTPVNHLQDLLPFIYLEEYKPCSDLSTIMQHIYPEMIIRGYESLKTFVDPVTGESYVFRNVFSCFINGKEYSIVLENITDDLSGFYRISKCINASYHFNITNLIFICLYNCNDEVIMLKNALINKFFNTPIYVISYDDYKNKKSPSLIQNFNN